MKRERCLPILPYTVISIHHKCNIRYIPWWNMNKKHLRWNSWRGEGHCNRIFRIVFVIANKFSAIRLHYSITCINHLSESQWAFQREFLSVQFRLSYQATMFKSALLRKGHRVSRKNRALIVRFVLVPWQITRKNLRHDFDTPRRRAKHVRSIENVPCTRTSYVRVHWHTNASFDERRDLRLLASS